MRSRSQGIELIRLLLDLTRRRQIQWRSVKGEDRWEARAGKEVFTVEFIYLARTDETGSDRTMARLHAFLMFDYCIGTEGMDLICEMLSLGDKEWTQARRRGAQRIRAGLAFLRRLKKGSRR